MNITADTVKELREKTGAGMMECKKALTEAEGGVEKALDPPRQKGLAAVKKGRGGSIRGIDWIIYTYGEDRGPR